LEDFKTFFRQLLREWLLLHEREPQAGSDFFIVLVETPVDECHDTPIGLAAAFAHFDDFGLHVNSVAMKQRLWKSHLVPTEIGDRRPLRGISNRNSHHHAQSQTAVDEPLSELRRFHVFGIEMERRRIVSHRREKDIVRLGDRAVHWMIENHSHFEFLEIKTCHRGTSHKRSGTLIPRNCATSRGEDFLPARHTRDSGAIPEIAFQ